MMRYFFVSDIHGCYDKLISALEVSGFNKEKDTIVNVGDAFDRGPQSKEVLEYLMSCPNRILIWGNHDLRLRELIREKDYPARHDFSNGVPETLKSFTLIGRQAGMNTQIYLFNREQCYKETVSLLNQYFRECCYAIEFPNLIATHAWLPCIEKQIPDEEMSNKINYYYTLREDWREIKSKDYWEDVTWCHSQLRWQSKAFPEKTLLIGHWHAFRFAAAAGEKRFNASSVNQLLESDKVDCSTYIAPDGKFIAIDGCSNLINGGKVNVYIYESDSEPILYRC